MATHHCMRSTCSTVRDTANGCADTAMREGAVGKGNILPLKWLNFVPIPPYKSNNDVINQRYMLCFALWLYLDFSALYHPLSHVRLLHPHKLNPCKATYLPVHHKSLMRIWEAKTRTPFLKLEQFYHTIHTYSHYYRFICITNAHRTCTSSGLCNLHVILPSS